MNREPRSLDLEVELESGERLKIPLPRDARSLADVLAAHGLPLNTRCGQRGLCRGCEVELREGALAAESGAKAQPVAASAFSLSSPEGGEGRGEEAKKSSAQIPSPQPSPRLGGERELVTALAVKACCARITEAATIFVPSRSRLEHKPQVSETFEIAVPYAHQPLFPHAAGGRDTAFAVDVGTTTVVVLLVDLVTGAVLSRAGGFNGQIRFGDNVVTRIEAARHPETLAAMQRAIVMETIQPLLLRACERAGRLPERLAGGALAGNTTMLHLLTGEDPTPLGIAPFTPRFLAGRKILARDIKLVAVGLAPATPLQLLPGIAAYIGADITAGVLASGMVFDPKPSLLVDIGTNGEIVLQADGQLTACATAAGPAFEGGGLRCGTRARDGAVSDLRLQLDPFALETEVIGDVPLARAHGLCGSAYVDFLATARKCGLLGANGRFDLPTWEKLPEPNRFLHAGRRAFRLAAKNGADDLRVSEADVALLLQAKAAIGAGIEILLETAGLRAGELGRVYLAGGFGMHLNVAHAIAIGLLPGFRAEQVRVVGNTSLAGALLALVDRTTLAEMEALRAQVRVIELNLAPDFEDRYIEHLMLPLP